MATGGAALPPWDRDNPDVQELLSESPYKDVLNKSRNNLVDELDLDALWPHLKTLKAIRKVNIERLTHNKPRPDAVDALIDYIERRPVWNFHALLRAMVLTHQTQLIPLGGPSKAIYTQGCQSDRQGGAPLKLLSKDVLRVIQDHCQSYQSRLMRRHVYDFDGDAGDDVVDISSCIIDVDPCMKYGPQMRQIPTNDILEQLHDKNPPRVIRLYGDPGNGKTSLMRHIAHHWATKFPQLTENDKYIATEPLPWTTLVYLEARNIKTTVDDAIREALGCAVSDVEVLMNHVRTGHRVGLLMDSIDELRNKAAIEELKKYVHERKMKGGPTVLMSARTDICPIDAQDIDRFLTLQGFRQDEGILYVRKYTKMYRLPDHVINRYVVKHRMELQPVLTNPLRLYIFSALALRGEIKLEDDGQFNIPKLFHPLERYLLRRSGTQVTEQQSKSFYCMCLWGLLKGLREFSGILLEHFNIVPAYDIFLQRSDRRRSEDGELVPYYTFSHEMVWEYFAACYMQTLSTQQKEEFLISLCKNKNLRNLQKIVFQQLLHDWNENHKLLQIMIRCILSLQDGPSRNTPKETHLCGFVKIKEQSESSLEDMLYFNEQELRTTDASAVLQQVNNAFDNSTGILREKAIFGDMKENGTIQHVVDCLQVCTVGQRTELLQHTVLTLLPCRHKDLWDKFRVYLQTGDSQWGQVHDQGASLVVSTCTPREAANLLTQYVRMYYTRASHPPWWSAKIYLYHKDYTLWGEPPDCSWCKEDWHKLFNKLLQLQVKGLGLYVDKGTPLIGVLMYMLDQAAALHKMTIGVHYGTIQLNDLVTLLPACLQAGLHLVLGMIQVVVPSDVEESTLRVHRDSLSNLTYNERGERRLYRPVWLTEDGQRFVWVK